MLIYLWKRHAADVLAFLQAGDPKEIYQDQPKIVSDSVFSADGTDNVSMGTRTWKRDSAPVLRPHNFAPVFSKLINLAFPQAHRNKRDQADRKGSRGILGGSGLCCIRFLYFCGYADCRAMLFIDFLLQ